MNKEELVKKFDSFKDDYSQEDADKVFNNQNEIENIVKRKKSCKNFVMKLKISFNC